VSKATVTKLFIGSAVAAVAGTVLAIAAIWIAIANDVFVMSGQNVVGIEGGTFAWFLLGLAAVGGLAFFGAMVGGLVSWIGALLNTAQLESKTWFLVLLLLGIFSFGLVAMIAYVIAGPDGTEGAAPRTSPSPA
jgi:hypothetical protein